MKTRVSPSGPTEIYVVSRDDRLFEWRQSLRVKVPGAEYTPKFQRGDWDGYYYPGKFIRRIPGGGWDMVCSRGLLHRIEKDLDPELEGDLYQPHLVEREVALIEGYSTLRDYQKKGLVFSLLKRWGRMALATNAGKGAIIGILSAIFESIREHRTLILCDEISVFNALKEEMSEWAEIDLGFVESGVQDLPAELVVLAMVPTLHRRLTYATEEEPRKEERAAWKEWCGSFEAVLMDEADKASAKSWKSILRCTQNSVYRLGFSGTFPDPEKDPYSSLLMDELMGPVLVEEKNIDLVERGISARPEVFLHGYDAFPYLQDRPVTWWDLSGPEKRLWVYEQGIVLNHHRHEFIASLLRPGISTCIIVTRIQHGEQLEEVIEGSRFLSGSATKTQRDDTLKAFARGDFNVLIVTKILDRGTNRLGHAVDLIFASGEGSKRQSLQRIGRGLRRTDGKAFLILRDIIDKGQRYLHSAGSKRIRLYHEEGFHVRVGEDA